MLLARHTPNAVQRRTSRIIVAIALTCFAWAALATQPRSPRAVPEGQASPSPGTVRPTGIDSAGTSDPAELLGYRLTQPPIYPKAAIDSRLEGTVILRVEVLADGVPGRIEVESSSSQEILDQSAIEAVQRWRFNPGRDGSGAEAGGMVLVPITFSLTGGPVKK